MHLLCICYGGIGCVKLIYRAGQLGFFSRCPSYNSASLSQSYEPMSSSSLHSAPLDRNRRSWHKKSQLVDSMGGEYIVFTHDISLTGMSLFADKQYKPGQICNIDVPVFVGSALRNYRFNCRVIFSSLCGMKGFRTNLEFLDVPAENRSLIQSVMAR